jgi:hypothetical protein
LRVTGLLPGEFSTGNQYRRFTTKYDCVQKAGGEEL